MFSLVATRSHHLTAFERANSIFIQSRSFTLSSSVFTESLVTMCTNKMVLEIKWARRRREEEVHTMSSVNKLFIVPRKVSNKTLVNTDYYFPPPPPSLLTLSDVHLRKGGGVTLTERGWQSRRALAGLISIALLCSIVCKLQQRLMAAGFVTACHWVTVISPLASAVQFSVPHLLQHSPFYLFWVNMIHIHSSCYWTGYIYYLYVGKLGTNIVSSKFQVRKHPFEKSPDNVHLTPLYECQNCCFRLLCGCLIFLPCVVISLEYCLLYSDQWSTRKKNTFLCVWDPEMLKLIAAKDQVLW